MPYELPLTEPWASQGWKAKIFDVEGPEEPHVTVRFRVRAWRISLRSGDFLNSDPPRRDVPDGVVSYVHEHLPALVTVWDRMQPHNLVRSPEPEAEEVPEKPKVKKRKKRSKK